jgi:hypothetical protein
MRFVVLCAMLVVLCFTASGQVVGAPAPEPFLGYVDSYQLNLTQNLNTADAAINLSNAGAHTPAGNFAIRTGYLCANIYVFGGFNDVDPQGEQLQACCSCPISRNGSASVRARELTRNLLTPVTLHAATLKIVWTVPAGGPNSTSCNAAALPTTNLLAGAPPAPANYGGFATGGRAWATHWHALGTPEIPLPAFGTETQFTNVPLSPAERDVLNNLCGFIQGNGSGFGICPGCPTRGAQGPGRR